MFHHLLWSTFASRVVLICMPVYVLIGTAKVFAEGIGCVLANMTSIELGLPLYIGCQIKVSIGNVIASPVGPSKRRATLSINQPTLTKRKTQNLESQRLKRRHPTQDSISEPQEQRSPSLCSLKPRNFF
ncbi:hypothetical protein CC80DRAFT_89037 [Byssothecium circinans]|uniref:Uncharacterized protein n=1 Tax=Byssothecium circinans TaxID=147558 RepID=A0A6A5TT57_9PLEO|nr:hypothetical protein CC80DRAFT_89037 [Byssothecium circinans]